MALPTVPVLLHGIPCKGRANLLCISLRIWMDPNRNGVGFEKGGGGSENFGLKSVGSESLGFEKFGFEKFGFEKF